MREMGARHADPVRPWRALRPVLWPETGNPHRDLVLAAIEARLYPYGDLESSHGRPVCAYQIQILERGRREGMDDREVGAFLSANLMCGGNPVYRRVARDLSWAGTVCLAGAYGASDVMGRRPSSWAISTTLPRGTVSDWPAMRWTGEDALQVVRSVLAVPWKALPCETEAPAWERDQGVLF
jgi:hypothetical protein